MLTEAKIKEEFKSLGITPPKTIFYGETDSTNTRAKEYAKSHPENNEPILFVADSQTAGRGRMGRSFVSNEGAGIYMSLLLYPDEHGFDATRATAKAAVALSRAVDSLAKVKSEIKWVNDVYLGNKKLAGILCEGEVLQNGKIGYLIIGMGINVYKNALSDEISAIATSLEHESDIIPSRSELTARIAYEMLNFHGEFFEEYKTRSMLIGRKVRVIKATEEYDAMVIGLNDDFSLQLERDGNPERLFTGEVSIKI